MDGNSSPQSFRDPDARLFLMGDRVFRFLKPSAADVILNFLRSPAASSLVAQKQLVSSVPIPAPFPAAEPGEWLEHNRIWFPSFPFEWPPEMLYQAGLLTLTLSKQLLQDGYELKDATPFNVLFNGSQPVFIDVASVQAFDPRALAWHAYAQFVQSFLLPLLVSRLTGLRIDWIFGKSREGLSPSELQGVPGLWRSFVGLRFVLLPRMFERGQSRSRGAPSQNKTADVGLARFVRGRLYRGLKKNLHAVYPPAPVQNDVTGYAVDRAAAETEQTRVKRATVEAWLAVDRPRRVLDVGANTGDFSFTATAFGASVVAIDKVPEAVSSLYRKAHQERADIQPLVVDLMRPTPALGWRNAEHPSFIERAAGAFDLVLFLAVIHHVVINDRVPLPELFQLLAQLTTSALIIEFVSREDANFVLVSRGRDVLFTGYTQDWFEASALEFFRIEARVELPGGTRTLYLMKLRRSTY